LFHRRARGARYIMAAPDDERYVSEACSAGTVVVRGIIGGRSRVARVAIRSVAGSGGALPCPWLIAEAGMCGRRARHTASPPKVAYAETGAGAGE